jgi:hypothetical protein
MDLRAPPVVAGLGSSFASDGTTDAITVRDDRR